MLRSRDFYLKNVYNIKGKKLGVIEDIYIDFFKGKVTGFKCSISNFFQKKNYIDIDDVIEFGDDIIIFEEKQGNGLGFKSIKNIEVIDVDNNVRGILEDIIIDDYEYSIKGIVISSGLIDRLIKGKEVLLLDQCILGDEFILYTGKDNIKFKTMPHKMERKNEFSQV